MDMAKVLYVQAEYSLERIAEMVGVSIRTIRNWKADNSWDDLKGLFESSSIEQARRYQKQIDLILDIADRDGITDDSGKLKGPRPLTASETDIIYKLERMIATVKGEVGFSETSYVFKQFTRFVMGRDPELAKQFVSLQDAYMKSIFIKDE